MKAADTTKAVDDFMAKLDHPHKRDIETLPKGGLAIDDPQGLLKWLGPDRAMVELGAGKELAGKAAAFQAVLRQWIRLTACEPGPGTRFTFRNGRRAPRAIPWPPSSQPRSPGWLPRNCSCAS